MILSQAVGNLIAFGVYAILLVVLAGQAFTWNENRTRFYLAGRNLGLRSSLSTFCATWMSAASLVGYTLWFYRDGYVAFTGSVNGWMLGLLALPFAVIRLRKSRALSLPEWLASEYGDARLRTLGASALLLAYVFYIVTQFQAFGGIVSHMLDIPSWVASLLVYLFVLYTTFGGLASVASSDEMNLALILIGVTVPAVYMLGRLGNPIELHRSFAALGPDLMRPFGTERPTFIFPMMLAWGLGVAANPQYAIRIMSASSRRTAYSMLVLAPLIVGWIYVCLTLTGMGGRVLLPSLAGPGDDAAFSTLITAILPPLPAMLLLVGVLAAAVSTANSQLLLAACSWCYDLPFQDRTLHRGDFGSEERFLVRNRFAIAAIASLCLCISQLPLPGILRLGRYSWTVVALCFFLPMYLPERYRTRRLFPAVVAALALHHLLLWLFPLPAEMTMLPSLLLELTFVLAGPERTEA